jgi:hypothetical protein
MKKYKTEIIGILSAMVIFSIAYFAQREVVAIALTYFIAKEIIKNR